MLLDPSSVCVCVCVCVCVFRMRGDNMSKLVEFFTISPQYKNGNIENFVLAMSFKI